MCAPDIKASAKKVLDYWYILEFLSQENDRANLSVKRSVADYKAALSSGGQEEKKSIRSYFILDKESLYDRLLKEATACRMKVWGNLTVYLGQIPRQTCIDAIRQYLPKDADFDCAPEDNTEQIACLSLQLSPKGEYVDGSLSLSPILWAVAQLNKSTGEALTSLLDEKLYRKDIQALEYEYFLSELGIDAILNDASNQQPVQSEDDFKAFSAFAITGQTLLRVLNGIKAKFVEKHLIGTDETDCMKMSARIEFQLFSNEQVKAEKDSDNYRGLSRSYYSEDLSWLSEAWINQDASHPDMQDELLRYLLSPHCHDEDARQDLVCSQKDDAEQLRLMSRIFDIENAPLGKWPSRYMPAFMQQAAINLSLGKFKESQGREIGRIFSVNGPPGTGKTTLLKEIIVSNIVDRAILLSQYEKADDAFISHNFIGGHMKDGRYDEFIPYWYSLDDDRINDYGLVVASCNNAAVENISKELPISMVKDLAPMQEDSPELVEALNEIAALFAPGDASGIYFTKYAQSLFGDSDHKVWGLISAPLGKKTNVDNFYYDVLMFLLKDMQRNEQVEAHEESYARARRQFIEQKNKVAQYRDRLREPIVLFSRKLEAGASLSRAEEQFRKGEADYTRQCESSAGILSHCNGLLNQLRANYDACRQQLQQLQNAHDATTEDREKLERERKDCLDKADQIRPGIFTKLFNKNKAASDDALADDYESRASYLAVRISQQNGILNTLELQFQQKTAECSTYECQISEQEEIRSREQFTLDQAKALLDNLKKNACAAKEAYEKACADYSELVQRIAQNSSEKRILLDERFMEQLLSQDTDISTKAQVANPWMTELYNREREKLFACALRMNQEFVLSSKSLRSNYKTLAQYWRVAKNNQKEQVILDKRDRDQVVPALFQSLFLLVPVISTTFASVASLFKDVKKAGALGLLIVDEAGQAQPQMAMGALYRCRRAMIVGDPRQVEPVVTDDLSLLKKAYTDSYLAPYKSKILSVQSFADAQNRYGTYLPSNDGDGKEWVGCPLLVHRRCISPMYDISNQISYNNMMKQQTREPKDSTGFTLNKSQWINVIGSEVGKGNHFVKVQGEKVLELLKDAFSKSETPSIFIISPFKSVVSGIENYIKDRENELGKEYADYMSDNASKRIGTVHTFQGREADEVIFLLGCDRSPGAKGAIRWVNENIVNVAATRAKYRLYVIGDAKAWEQSRCVSDAKRILDTYAIKRIAELSHSEMDGEKREKELRRAIEWLPSVTSFAEETVDDQGSHYGFETDSFASGISTFIDITLTDKQMEKFGFKSVKDLDVFSQKVKENLLMGMKAFYFFEPLYQEVYKELDAATCAIWFCKALELHMQDCFCEALTRAFPDFPIAGKGGKKNVPLKDVDRTSKMTLGTIAYILKENLRTLPQALCPSAADKYDVIWWESFENKLRDGTRYRNSCCHSGVFTWGKQALLLFDMFCTDVGSAPENGANRKRKINGIMFDSQIAKGGLGTS